MKRIHYSESDELQVDTFCDVCKQPSDRAVSATYEGPVTITNDKGDSRTGLASTVIDLCSICMHNILTEAYKLKLFAVQDTKLPDEL